MIKVLLDTNIIVYRESDNVYKDNIGTLYNIIDNSQDMVKFIHPIIREEILQNIYDEKRKILLERLKSYNMLEKTSRKISDNILRVTATMNKDKNDHIDDIILNEIYNGNADLLITEDKKMKRKALELGIVNKVQTIDEFLYKSKISKKVNHDILDIKKVKMKELNIEDCFFDDLKKNYPGFEEWFKKKGEEEAYCYIEDKKIKALLLLKNEEIGDDNYLDIKPRMKMNRKLKISTFKVDIKGKKIGERFMKIIFDQAKYSMVDEIYVTIFDSDEEKRTLISYLERFGFIHFGVKSGRELVYIRNMRKTFNNDQPLKSYPYIKIDNDTFVIAINPIYHTYLLPDSKLKREIYANKNVPVEYAIKKYYVSNAGFMEKPKIGDNIVFYRTKQEPIPAKYSSVLTTVGIVINVIVPHDVNELCNLVRNKTVYEEKELKEKYTENTYIIEFAYVTTLDPKLNYEVCQKNHILYEYPRGVSRISSKQFKKIVEIGEIDTSIIV